MLIRHLWQLNTAVFLHRRLIDDVLSKQCPLSKSQNRYGHAGKATSEPKKAEACIVLRACECSKKKMERRDAVYPLSYFSALGFKAA